MTRAEFKDNTNLMLQKGIYPYDYIKSFDIFAQSSQCKIEDFKSSLDSTDISEEDYNHYLHVWNTFNIQNLGEYHDLYCKSDTLLLSDIFENFRRCAHKNYSLDPAYYIT